MKKEPIIRWKPLLLAALFVAFYGGITLFSHIHRINGALIVHSHLSNSANHTHTNGEIVILSLLENAPMIALSIPITIGIIQSCIYTFSIPKRKIQISYIHYYSAPLRAPPCLI